MDNAINKPRMPEARLEMQKGSSCRYNFSPTLSYDSVQKLAEVLNRAVPGGSFWFGHIGFLKSVAAVTNHDGQPVSRGQNFV